MLCENKLNIRLHGLVNLDVTSEMHVLSQISAVSFTRFCGEDVIWGFPWKGGRAGRLEIHVAKVRNWCENESVHVGLTNGVSIKWYAEFFTSSRSRSSAFARQTKLRTTELNSAQLSQPWYTAHTENRQLLQTWNFSSITLPRSSEIGQLTLEVQNPIGLSIYRSYWSLLWTPSNRYVCRHFGRFN